MLLTKNVIRPSVSSLLLCCAFAVAVMPSAVAQATRWEGQEIAQSTENTETEETIPNVLPEIQEASPEDLSDPNNLRPLTQADSLLSLRGGERLMGEASQAIDAQNYALAGQKLQEARQVFNQLSNFYQQLAGSFSGIDNRISEALRGQALETAQMRDQATYQLALVHRAQSQPELAVPLLIQIIRSQSPTTDLGKKAYGQLYELGFVNSPYPRPRNTSSSGG